MEKPNINKIIEVMEKHNFTIFKNPFSVNLGGIRTFDMTSNKFNDFLYAFYYDSKGTIYSAIVEGTTDAGLYYRVKPMNKNGTAVIVHNMQHKGVYQLQDPEKNPDQKGHSGKKAFRQVQPMSYWRDNDKDGELDCTGPIYKEVGYTNMHYMGTKGDNVDNWSAGCCGATVKNLNQIFAIADVQIAKGLGDIYSLTLLHENLF